MSIDKEIVSCAYRQGVTCTYCGVKCINLPIGKYYVKNEIKGSLLIKPIKSNYEKI